MELDWWEHTDLHGLRVVAAPCQVRGSLAVASAFTRVHRRLQHWSNRTPFDKNKTLWCTYAIVGQHRRVSFIGDTGAWRGTPADCALSGWHTLAYCPEFEVIGQTLGPFDILAVPIGAYEPRELNYMVHCNPEEAIQIGLDMKAQLIIGHHFGTCPLSGVLMLHADRDDLGTFAGPKHGFRPVLGVKEDFKQAALTHGGENIHAH